jgi:hypothetical protein
MTTARVQVEQAVAFGRSLDWIIDHLGVEPAFVDDVLRGMEEAAAEDDDPEPAPTPQRFTWEGRPLSSYFGPAHPAVIEELVDAVCPRRKRAAA